MSDFIKREDAIDACLEETSTKWSTKEEAEEGRIIANVIKSLPSADVAEVRHGHWIAVTVSSGRDSWECSECGRRARGKIENLPYCHCGARMDGGNDE